MRKLIFDDLETAKENAIRLHEENTQIYSLINTDAGIWVTKKYSAKKAKATPFWDTEGKIPRARNSPRFWTDAEKQLVIDNYAKTGAKIIAPRLGKSADSVQAMAAKLGVRHNKKPAMKNRRV